MSGKKGGKKGGADDEPQFKFNFTGDQVAAAGKVGAFDLKGTEAALVPLMQKKLQKLIGTSSGYFESLPAPVQNRVKGLKALHYQKEELDEEYKKELAALDEKYRLKFNPLYARRDEIVTGKAEPTEEEIKLAEKKQKEEESEEDKKEVGEKKEEEKKEEEKKEEEKKEEKGEDIKGIPDFWLQALKHHDYFMDLITPEDEAALKYLQSIREIPGEIDGSFTLEFVFAPNGFFSNDVLKKTYHMVEHPGTGSTLYDRVECTEIEWAPGKCLTRKLVKVPQGKGGGGRGKKGRRGGGAGGGGTKMITVEKPCKSFFNFFSPDAAFEEEGLEEDELDNFLEEDYELGCALREQLLPNAVLWYTGEASVFGDEGEDDEEGEEGEEGDEEYNSDEDEDFEPPQPGEGQQQQQCAQQ